MNAKLLLALAACAAPALFAEETAAPATPETKPAVQRYELKALSSFKASPEARPPFWPIGWVHRQGVQKAEPVGPKYTLDEKNFAITSILMGPPALAVINGRAYEEGQFLKIKLTAPLPGAAPQAAAPAAPRIRVQRITDGQVWLAYDSQIVAIALKRPELNERKAEQDMLNEDKEDLAPAPAVSKR